MGNAEVQCEVCGHKQVLARPFIVPEIRYVLCHECECTLEIEVTEATLAEYKARAGKRKT